MHLRFTNYFGVHVRVEFLLLTPWLQNGLSQFGKVLQCADVSNDL